MSLTAAMFERSPIVGHLPSIEAELNYLAATNERPRTYTYDPPPGVPRTTFVDEPHRVPIHDVRPLAHEVSLDAEGFALLDQRSAMRDFYDEDEIKRVYYRESEALLRHATGANRVLIFDHTVRRRVPGTRDRGPGPRQPALRVHVDHTERSAPQRVRDLLPDEAADLLTGRVQIINLWRPIRWPVRDAPLAVVDARSVAPADLIPADLVHRDRVGESYAVTFNPAHVWFYVPEMRPDEGLLFKCYDSEVDGRARFTPHSAFIDTTAPPDAPPRESIELRTLVFG
jgi:hypothetical protein